MSDCRLGKVEVVLHVSGSVNILEVVGRVFAVICVCVLCGCVCCVCVCFVFLCFCVCVYVFALSLLCV